MPQAPSSSWPLSLLTGLLSLHHAPAPPPPAVRFSLLPSQTDSASLLGTDGALGLAPHSAVMFILPLPRLPVKARPRSSRYTPIASEVPRVPQPGTKYAQPGIIVRQFTQYQWYSKGALVCLDSVCPHAHTHTHSTQFWECDHFLAPTLKPFYEVTVM